MVFFPLRLPEQIIARIKSLAQVDGLTPSGLARTLIISAVRVAEREQREKG